MNSDIHSARPSSSSQFARLQIGDMTFIGVSDGSVSTSLESITGIERPDVEKLLASSASTSPLNPVVNAFVLERPGSVMLVDTGAGVSMGTSCGHLPANLNAAGISTSAIDTVLLTHIHPDHSNGLIDAAGSAVFPHAELLIPEDDYRFWVETDPDTAPERFRRNMNAARKAVAPYRERIRMVREGEAKPGVFAIPLPGHTPGHTGYLIASGSGDALVWGDIVHLAAVQIPNPDAGLTFDVDASRARATRYRIFDQVHSERILVASAHMDTPGLGYLTRDRGRYAFVAETSVECR